MCSRFGEEANMLATSSAQLRRIIATMLPILAVVCAGPLSTPADAATPSTIAVEGRLMTVAGGPITDGKYSVTFLLYASAQAKTPVWSETVADLVVKSGVFQHALGTVKSLSPSMMDSGKTGWLAIRIGKEPELSRRKMHAAPYAMRAGIADGANFPYAGAKTKGGPASDVACTGCVGVAEMKFDGPVDLGGNSLKAKVITSSDMIAGTVKANSFIGDGSKLTGVKMPAGKCKPGMVVVGLDSNNQLICASSADSLPKDGLGQVSNGVLSTEFKATFTGKSNIKIPDNNPIGVADSVLIPDLGTAKKLTVTVQLTNSNLKSVAVILYDANKGTHLLYDKGTTGKSLKGTWPSPDKQVSGDLTKWWGANPKGTWTLKVVDTAFLNNTFDGVIGTWRIDVETLSDKQVQVHGGLLVNGAFRFPLLDKPPFACDASKIGFSYLNTADGDLYVCRIPGWTAALFRQCGNNVKEVGEDCDDGNLKGGDACPATCKFTCGDGLCTPAKGESFNTCKKDCPVVDGQIVFKNPGSQSWKVPVGITLISAVAVGAGGGGGGGTDGGNGGRGGGGGALVWGNNIPVKGGETLTIVIGKGGKQGVHSGGGQAGTYTELRRGGQVLMRANGGPGGGAKSGSGVKGGQANIGGYPFNKGGGNGGDTRNSDGCGGSGGGGAGGYSGKGGIGGQACNSGTPGAGGGGAGGDGSNGQTAGGGGGVGLKGIGANGKNDVSGNNNDGAAGGGGSGGANGIHGSSNNGGHGGLYGGGGGGSHDTSNGSGGNGANGGLRIMWGQGRSYPSKAADK